MTTIQESLKFSAEDFDHIMTDILVMTSRAFTIVSLILVSVWASSDKSMYLGLPIWETNALSWHAVLMVAGLYFCLIFANTLFVDKVMDRDAHWLANRWVQVRYWFWQVGIVTFGIAALVAIVYYKDQHNISHEASFHAWIGSLSIGAVFYFIILEAIRQILNISKVDHPYLTYGLRVNQQFITILGVVSTTIAVITGASDFLSVSGGCNFTTNDQSNIYFDLTSGCRIGNGMQLCIFFATAFALLAGAMQSVQYVHQSRNIRFSRYMEDIEAKNAADGSQQPQDASLELKKGRGDILEGIEGGYGEEAKQVIGEESEGSKQAAI
jgi:hypothetical protein